MSGYDWATIVGAFREVVKHLKVRRHLLGLDPAQDRQSFVLTNSAWEALSPLGVVWHCFTIDPRRDDGIGVRDDQVADMLHLYYQGDGDEFLQGAALELWVEFQALWSQQSRNQPPQYDDARIAQLERAIDTVANLAAVDVSETGDGGDGDGEHDPSGRGSGASTIPPQFRTCALTKRKAAGYLRQGNPDSAVEWLNNCINDGTISCETLSRQSHVFDVRQFPENVRANLLPK